MILERRSAGVLLHVTSLPGPHGIGDFGPGACQFIDWLAAAGQSVWQVLPTTPVGPCDSPYQSVSAFAGSPLMVAFEPLVAAGWLEQVSVPPDGFDSRRVDYARVMPWRLAVLRDAVAGFRMRAGASHREAFGHWRDSQAAWLDDYALFMALETAHGGQPWWNWAAELRARDPSALAAARSTHADEIFFWEFVQWCFDTQCAAIRQYANDRGISIMGDLPIFIAHHSADCWARPDLYFLDEHYQPTVVAGVPPDDMGPLGQRWGNPLYRWDRMAAEDFSWWTARVQRALGQADLLRIDHFRGFAGYWEIPSSCPTATEGRWVPAPGAALFAAIERALGKLPIVAEDLGLITPDVIELRDGCGFPGMKILQFAFGGDGGHEFLPHNYTRETVVYTGTHDNETARGWWENAQAHEKHFAGIYLHASGEDIHWRIIQGACNSIANMAVFQMQDVLGLDGSHRMNLPGTTENNWSWRFDWSMVPAQAGHQLSQLTSASGRSHQALR